MNNTLKTILISTIAVLCGVFAFTFNVSAEPEDPLVVQFEKSPLFSETSFLPGDTVMRWIKVWNNSGETQPIAVEAINVNNPDGLGDVLYLQIKEGTDILFDGTLKSFFDIGDVYLSDLANGNQTEYDFYVTFDANSGEEYAGKVLGFDFRIGFQGEELTVQSNGGGGAGSLTNLLSGNENETEEPQGEVLGEATFRTSLPKTGGPLLNWLFKDNGAAYVGSQAMQTNILIAGAFILIMLVLVIVRKFVLK